MRGAAETAGLRLAERRHTEALEPLTADFPLKFHSPLLRHGERKRLSAAATLTFQREAKWIRSSRN